MEQKPEPTYTRKQVQQVLDAAIASVGRILSEADTINRATNGVWGDVYHHYEAAFTTAQNRLRAINIDKVLKGE